MRIRVFRDLVERRRILEIGRLRLWLHSPPMLYYNHHYGARFIGIGYFRAMLFDAPRGQP